MSSSRIFRTSPRDGRKSGNGAPAQTSTRTSRRSASCARRWRSTTCSRSRTSAKSGVKCQPVRWTCERARCSSAAMAGRACAPSIRTSTALPDRGGGSPAAQPPGRRVECAVASDTPQTTPMMGADQPTELVSEPTLGREQHLPRQRSQPAAAGTPRLNPALGLRSNSAVARVAERVERERDQSGGDDPEQERPVGVVRRSSPAHRRGRLPCSGCSRSRP